MLTLRLTKSIGFPMQFSRRDIKMMYFPDWLRSLCGMWEDTSPDDKCNNDL